ncbi:MAG: hypothetical protein KC482_15535 [Dehalococcoidia bacterium]|nr:hypothetical protein [Dehalococcoidia bacterium]MCA9854971.1 hypothetical protein [Dehalococcoidia bacterium]
MARTALVFCALVLFAACAQPAPATPTIAFPTPVPTDLAGTATPRTTGACTLLTAVDIRETLGVEVLQASSSPLSCGYAHGTETVVLTLLGSFVWQNYLDALSATDSPQPLAVGAQSFYFPATLDGLVMTQQDQEVYLLSGIPTAEAGADLMTRVLARATAEEQR